VVVEEFTYDELDRLDDIETTRNGAADPLIDVNYDFLGNITSKTGVGNYEYLNASGAVDRPHLVKRIKDAANAVKATFEYDGVGNTTQRSGEGVLGGNQTFTYTPFNLPRQVTVGAVGTAKRLSYEYGADQRRVLLSIDTDGNLTTAEEERVYAGDLYERVEGADAGGDVTRHLYKVFAHGRRVAHVEREVRSGVSIEESRYVHADHLGSSSALTDETGAVVHVQRFDAFGAPESPAAQSADVPTRNVRSGYTAHEMDSETGLVNMRGRIYDPRLGRFLQADPILRPGWSQGLTRYSYAFNNPLRWVDPTGFDAEDEEEDQLDDTEEEEEQLDTTGADAGFVWDADTGVLDLDPDAGEVDEGSVDDGADDENELAIDASETESIEDAQVDDATYEGEGEPSRSRDAGSHQTFELAEVQIMGELKPIKSSDAPIIVVGTDFSVTYPNPVMPAIPLGLGHGFSDGKYVTLEAGGGSRFMGCHRNALW
jgi:RHS repeat-associated protein